MNIWTFDSVYWRFWLLNCLFLYAKNGTGGRLQKGGEPMQKKSVQLWCESVSVWNCEQTEIFTSTLTLFLFYIFFFPSCG